MCGRDHLLSLVESIAHRTPSVSGSVSESSEDEGLRHTTSRRDERWYLQRERYILQDCAGPKAHEGT